MSRIDYDPMAREELLEYAVSICPAIARPNTAAVSRDAGSL